jgi:glc operon protein GlcG
MFGLSLDQSRRLVDLAIERATENFARPVCVAVCDHTGALLAFARMDGAPLRSVAIAQGKAYSAARMGVTTQAVLERLHREQIDMAHFCDPLLTPLPGGSPLKDAHGTLVGAVGISGLAITEDQQLSDAVAALLSL